jgi:hypothetical protein
LLGLITVVSNFGRGEQETGDTVAAYISVHENEQADFFWSIIQTIQTVTIIVELTIPQSFAETTGFQ